MQTKIIMQRNSDNTLANAITASFQRKPKKVYFLCGNFKDTGFRIIEDGLIDTKIKAFFAIGIDKKNTTRSMLEDVLRYTKDVYMFSNNGLFEFNANMSIFEYANEAVIYSASSNVSESGLIEDTVLYQEIIYDLDVSSEKDMYKKQIKDILKEVEIEPFYKLDKEQIEKLVEDKEIFTTRQYNHNVKSISELLGNNESAEARKETTKQEIDDVYVSDVTIPKVDLSDINIDLDDIDFSSVEYEEFKDKVEQNTKKKEDNVEIDYDNAPEEFTNIKEFEQLNDDLEAVSKDNELYDENLENIDFDENDILDINDLLFSKADLKLMQPVKDEKKARKSSDTDEDEVPEELKEEEILQGKKVNLNNVTNIIFELPSKTSKGQDTNSIKIPNYIKTMVPAFFELSEKGKNIEENGVKYKVRNINIEVADVKNDVKYTDREARMMYKTGQSYMTFVTNTLKNISFEENDIARIIKLSPDIYYIEIISKDMQEYRLWSKLCNQKIKSSDRRFGMM